MQLRDRVVWITGASSGIGAALAEACVERGARVILTARRAESLAELQSRLNEVAGSTDRVHVLPADLCDDDSRDAALAGVESVFGPVDVLVNNAGVTQRSEAHETSMDVYRQLMEINYFAAVALTTALLPSMRQRGSGQIVMIASIAGHFGTKLRSGYCAAKSALIGFAEAVRAENHDAGIGVTIVAPGFIRTGISLSALEGDGSKHGESDPAQERGVPVEQCARQIADAIEADAADVYIGGVEVRARFIKRFAPALFRRIIRRAEVT